MNEAIELHDSVLQSLEHADGTTTALLQAYVHRSTGRPGIDAGMGFSQSARVVIYGCMPPEVRLPLAIVTGFLRVGAESFDNLLPVPLARSGVVQLEVHGAAGNAAQLTGSGLSVQLVGDAREVDRFPGSEVR